MTRFILRAGLALLAGLGPGQALAQSIRVQAGEHDGFTRIVMTMDAPREWSLNRTAEGYDLKLEGPSAPLDLSTVFRIIPKTRLQAVWSDPANGRLQLRIGCACHAVPFEFRPDILVIDIKDGPPEAGSPHERSAAGAPMPELTARSAVRLRPRPAPLRDAAPGPRAAPSLPLADMGSGLPFVQLAYPLPPIVAAPTRQAEEPAPAQGPSGPGLPPDLSGMREVLLYELARAASAGVIDTRDAILPPPAPDPVPSEALAGAAAHLGLAELPGLSARPVNDPPAAMTAQGEACLPDSALDIAGWSDGTPYATQVSALRSKLLGEFDRPDPVQTERLVKLMLYFGFGAEARNLLQSFPVPAEQAALWTAMADILEEGSTSPGSPLAGQLACPGPVALWASLALPRLPDGATIDTAAVSRSFSALPVHLRRYLGPGLAERFLAAGDMTTTQRLRDAIWRAPGDPGDAAERFDGQLAMKRGRLQQAEDSFASVAGAGGPEAVRALIDLVDARLALGQAVALETVTDLAAYRHENKGGALEPLLLRAELLARASSGDYDTAFNMAADATDEVRRDLWALLAKAGPDSALLDHAVLASAADLPPVDPVTSERLGTRLLELGFPDEALLWLPGDNAVQVAEAELQRGDARAAMRAIAGLSVQEADLLRARSLVLLGDQRAAAAAFAAAGDEGAGIQALWRAEDWAAGAPPAPDPRGGAAGLLSPAPPVPGEGPLAQGKALVAESAAARAVLQDLLAATPGPTPVPD